MINNIRKIREDRKLTRQKLGDMIGVYPQYLYKIENKTDSIDALLLIKLAEALDVRPSDLVTFEDYVNLDSSNFDEMTKTFRQYKGHCARLVPVLTMSEVPEYEQHISKRSKDYLVLVTELGLHAFGILVSGSNLEPRCFAGDLIVVDPDVETVKGDLCICCAPNGSLTILIKTGEDDKYHYFESVGRTPDKMLFAKESIDKKIIGKVVHLHPLFTSPADN